MPKKEVIKIEAKATAPQASYLVKLEDLIGMAMGPPEKNVVNFKLMQTILLILARQMRMLGMQVEIRTDSISSTQDQVSKDAKTKVKDTSTSSAQGQDESSKTNEEKEKERAERHAAKEREKAEKSAQKEKEKQEKAERKEEERRKSKSGRDKGDKEGGSGGKDTNIGANEDKIDKSDKTDKRELDKEKEKKDRASGKTGKQGETGSDDNDSKSEKVVGDRKTKEKGLVRRSSGISVTEREDPKSGKVLVVEKGPMRELHKPHVADVEVVTQEEFEALSKAVQLLKEKAGPIPVPIMPDDAKLKAEIHRGSASLTDIMDAMALSTRVEKAEQTITTMAKMLTELASSGALPEELSHKAQELEAEVYQLKKELEREMDGDREKDGGKQNDGGKDEDATSITSKKSAGYKALPVSVDPTATGGGGSSKKYDTYVGPSSGGIDRRATDAGAAAPRPGATGPQVASASAAGSASRASTPLLPPGVISQAQLKEALEELRREMNRDLGGMVEKAGVIVNQASAQAKAVSDKIDNANQLNFRMNQLSALVGEYSEQLSGFDAGLTTQMQGFQEQMAQMRGDLDQGLALLQAANNNPDTAVVKECRERYDELVQRLDATLQRHAAMSTYQKELGKQFKSLVECVEVMNEMKADRDEVLDGLRDKADMSRLKELMSEEDFCRAKEEYNLKLAVCNDKFRKQEEVWLGAIDDYAGVTDTKADMAEFDTARERAEAQIEELHEMVRKITELLGDPKATFLCRKLFKEVSLGTGKKTPAIMDEPVDYNRPGPSKHPQMTQAWQRPMPSELKSLNDDMQCKRVSKTGTKRDDDKVHYCNRQTGGSHTVFSEACTREQAPAAPKEPPARRYLGPGTDNKMYLLEAECVPCEECNVKVEDEKIPGEVDLHVDGAGDAVTRHLYASSTHVIFRPSDDWDAHDDTVRPSVPADRTSKSHLHDKEGHSTSQDKDGSHRLSQLSDLHRRSISESKRNLPGTVDDIVRLEEIGTIVKGHVTLVDEDVIVREEIMHDMKTLEEQGVTENAEGTE